MQRLPISIDDDLARAFDALAREQGYVNRSEAFRDLVRRAVDERAVASGKARRCVAALSYVYDHHERRLGERLLERHHASHDLVIAATHVHIDHANCLESVLLRGPIRAVETFAASVIGERGVRHGRLHVVPVVADQVHAHPSRHAHDTPHS